MKPEIKRLLLRTAQRLERVALAKFEAAAAANLEQARRTRDAELGDVRDIKDYVKQADAGDDLFIVAVSDRRTDDEYFLVRGRDAAIERARDQVKAFTNGLDTSFEDGDAHLTEAMKRDGWVAFWKIGDEGDSVVVRPIKAV